MQERELLKRQKELFQHIDHQIQLCDDQNDVLLLAGMMLAQGYRILKDQYGKASADEIIASIQDHAK
jgi:hypothetical protein